MSETPEEFVFGQRSPSRVEPDVPVFPTAAPAQPVAAEPFVRLGQEDDGMLEITRPTPGEKALLDLLGWKPGQRIPRDLLIRANQLAAANQSLESCRLELAAAQAAEARKKADDEAMPEKPAPGAVEALRQIHEGRVPRLEIDDDVSATEAATPAPSQPPAETDGLSPDDSPTGAFPARRFCPHCNWDLALPDSGEVTDEDKRDYFAAFLGFAHFKKTYDLFDGQLQVTLRTLSPSEIDLCYEQCHVERQRGRLETVADLVEKLARYRTLLQLTRVCGLGQALRFPETVAGWGFAPPAAAGPGKEGQSAMADTVLPQILRAVSEKLLVSETIYRVLIDLAKGFNRLVDKLEVSVLRPDFWKATRSEA